MMSMGKDQYFCQIADKLIADYKLQKDKRVAIIATGNIGDFYFLVSALSYVQIKYDITFFVICNVNSKSYDILKSFKDNSANINIIVLSDNLAPLYFALSESTIMKYDRIIVDLEHSKAYPDLWHWMASPDTKENLARPKFNFVPAEKSLIPPPPVGQNNIFVIPHSNFHGTPELAFWRTICSVFIMLGFNVVVNGKGNIDYGKNVANVFPSLSQIVPYVDQFDLLFGIRTGLMEFVASETNTKVAVINHGKKLENDYPHIDPGKIAYWPTYRVRDTCFPYIDNLLGSYAKSLVHDFKYNVHGDTSSCLDLQRTTVFTYLWGMTKQPFQPYDQPYHATEAFCSIKYAVMQSDSFCVCKYAIKPALEYEIHACLKDAISGEILVEQHYIRCNPLVFSISHPGTFIIYVKIYHPNNYVYCYFETEPLNVDLSPQAVLPHINEFHDYMRYLNDIKLDCLIFVASRNSHTSPETNKGVYFDSFGAKLNPEKQYNYSWLLIVDAGEVVAELADATSEVSTKYAWADNRAFISSAGYNAHMNGKVPVSIKINGVEVAVNGQGLNIVVWDKERNMLLDSVAFDTYSPASLVTRLNKEFLAL